MENPYREQSNVNPQLEEGWRAIANPVFHALTRAGLNGGEYQVIFTVIDRTWGFQLPSRLVSLKQFEVATGLSRQGITKAIKSVEEKRIIVISRDGTKGSEYLFNKHWDTWKVPASQPQLPSEAEELGNHGLPDYATTVDQSRQPQLPSTRQLAEPSTEPVKKRTKETLKETLKEKDGSSPGLGAVTPSSEYLFQKTNRKRWPNLVQKEAFEKAESEVGEDRMKEAIDWALTSGISNIKAIITASRRKKDGKPGQRDARPGRVGSPGRRHEAPSPEEYRESKERYEARKRL